MANGIVESYVGGNRVLDLIGAAERLALSRALTVRTFRSGDVIQTPNGDVSFIDFPIDAVLSVVAEMSDGALCEVGTIGNEGAAGLDVAFGSTLLRTTVCQVEGRVARLARQTFLDAVYESRDFERLIGRVSQAQRFFVEQQCACNAVHTLEKRCARWFMMIHERVARDTFAVTHDYLSVMLGVRRPTVSQAAMRLQTAGIITYHRGVVRVLDRKKLAAACCECFEATQNVFESALTIKDEALTATA